MPDIVDDKSEHCILFILQRLEEHQNRYKGREVPPFFLGLNGVQGAGKTTLASRPLFFVYILQTPQPFLNQDLR